MADHRAHMQSLENNPSTAAHMRRTSLCRTLAGQQCDLITLTDFSANAETMRQRPVIVLSARVHPGETGASHMMKGVLDHLTGSSKRAEQLRRDFVFKIVPVLNPDGVSCGNYRTSLSGEDLNRQWLNPDPVRHPTGVPRAL